MDKNRDKIIKKKSEIINGVTMIPGILISIYSYKINADLIVLYTLYTIMCFHSMLYHFTNAYYCKQKMRLLKMDMISQQMFIITYTYIYGNQQFAINFLMPKFVSMVLLDYRISHYRLIGYVLNIFNIIASAIYMKLNLYIWVLICSTFLLNILYKNDWSHGMFHILLHINICDVFYKLNSYMLVK